MKLILTDNQLDGTMYWTDPIPEKILNGFSDFDLSLFDQNGYDMTYVELQYATANGYEPKAHRYLFTCKTPWFEDEDPKRSGPHLNHADLYFRHGFNGEAKEQLKRKAVSDPIFNKFVHMRPKWGVDISVDYADEFNVFELLHFEWDGFHFEEVLEHKKIVEEIVLNTDFNERAREMISRKDEWHHLGFFEQSDWKQKFWGLPKENFKEVIWK